MINAATQNLKEEVSTNNHNLQNEHYRMFFWLVLLEYLF
jgi:hypothetical protein